MSNYNELVTILKELLFNRFYPKPEYIRGLLGDGRGNVLVPGRPDYNYVRFSRTSTETFEVFNKEVSQPVDGWPVLIGEFPWQAGLIQVVATDWSAYAQTGWGDSVASIQAHAPTHEWPNFLPGSDAINVYLRAVTPMRTQAAGSGSTSVMVSSYEYDGPTGTNYSWPGTPPLSLATATPPSGSMRYMGVYLNPATNTLGVVTGSTTIYTDALEPDRPAWPRGVYPSAYVRLYGGQAAITERDIRDARRIWESTFIFTGTGSGLPEPVIPGAFLGGGAGTPIWTYVSELVSPDGSVNPAWIVDNSGTLLNDGGGQIDLQGVPQALILDGDGDSSIYAFTDDTVVISANGIEVLEVTPAGLELPNGGDVTLADGDFYANNDIYGLFDRLVNYGFTPDEHWRQNADELSWTGWASYTGFVTPDTISISNSIYRAAHNSGAAFKAFRYRAASTGANIFIRSRLSITQVVSAGVMIDDGSGNADGEGANNFARIYFSQAATGADAIQLIVQRRTGGGAVTTSITSHTIHPGLFTGLGINSAGTLWSNWTVQPFTFGESGARVVVVSAGSQTWTPARVGLYLACPAGNPTRLGLWDWYDEATG